MKHIYTVLVFKEIDEPYWNLKRRIDTIERKIKEKKELRYLFRARIRDEKHRKAYGEILIVSTSELQILQRIMRKEEFDLIEGRWLIKENKR